MGRSSQRPSVWCSKYYFFFIISCKILCKNRFNLFFYNFTKMKVKSFECPKSIRNYEKKIMLGTSDAWSMSRSSQRASVLYWRMSDFNIVSLSLKLNNPYYHIAQQSNFSDWFRCFVCTYNAILTHFIWKKLCFQNNLQIVVLHTRTSTYQVGIL